MPYRSAVRVDLKSFSLDEPDVADPFSARLRRENCWSVEYTNRAIQEYKRFVELAVSAAHPVTPSDAVDQVWHLHLTYTNSYWGSFCEGLLGRPLHHEPSRGGSLEHAKYRDHYEKTLEAYLQTFGEAPPEDIWPNVARRFDASQRFVRVSPATTFVVRKRTVAKAVAFMAAAAASSAVVLPWAAELSEPDASALFLLFWAGTVGFAVGLMRHQRMTAPGEVPELHIYEAAYLAGDELTVADAALASLVATNSLALDFQGSTVSKAGPLPTAAHAVEKAAYDCCRTPTALATAYASAADAAKDVGMRLRGLGLVLDPTSVPLWVALLAPLLAAGSFVACIAQGKPVDHLILPIILGVIVAVYFCRPRRVLSSLGETALAAVTQRHPGLDPLEPSSARSPGIVSLAVGLFGLAALTDLGLGGLRSPLERARETLVRSQGGGCSGGCGCGGCGCGG